VGISQVLICFGNLESDELGNEIVLHTSSWCCLETDCDMLSGQVGDVYIEREGVLNLTLRRPKNTMELPSSTIFVKDTK
jgi:hypothetical protein